MNCPSTTAVEVNWGAGFCNSGTGILKTETFKYPIMRNNCYLGRHQYLSKTIQELSILCTHVVNVCFTCSSSTKLREHQSLALFLNLLCPNITHVTIFLQYGHKGINILFHNFITTLLLYNYVFKTKFTTLILISILVIIIKLLNK